mgnify:FL=1
MIVNQTGGGSGEKYSKSVLDITAPSTVGLKSGVTIATDANEDDTAIVTLSGVTAVHVYRNEAWTWVASGDLSGTAIYDKNNPMLGKISNYNFEVALNSGVLDVHPMRDSSNNLVRFTFDSGGKVSVVYFKKE